MCRRVTGKGYMDVNRISGYIPGKMVFFLMQVTSLRITSRYRHVAPFFLPKCASGNMPETRLKCCTYSSGHQPPPILALAAYSVTLCHLTNLSC